MAESPSNPADSPSPAASLGRRLDSWKEIAAYLNRHFTTVQRWEKQEGLPVHRHVHDKLGSVYAYTSELDSWWKSRAPQAEPEPAEIQPPSQPRRTTHLLATVLVGAVAVGLLVARGALRDQRSGGRSTSIRAIAILPLADLSRDADQEYFADGITEALITELAKVKALKVVSRSSVMRYKGSTKPLPDIAQELHVEGIVTGAVARAGDRVRITSQLVDARSERHLWAETYERDVRDVLALQGDVARAIAGAVQVTVTAPEEARLLSARPVNVQAYERYLMGRYFWNRGTGEGFQKAIERFEQAIALDPTYAPAYAWLADACTMSTRFRTIPVDEANAKGKTNARKALELDGGLARAHVALGEVAFFYERDWPAAEEEFKRAMALDPNDPRTHQAYAVGLTCLARFDEAMNQIGQARELDPISLEVKSTAALILYFARRHDEAIAQARQALELDPDYPPARRFLGRALLAEGSYDEAISAFRQAMAAGGPALLRADLGYAYAVSGRRAEAARILSEMLDSAEHDGEAYDVAMLYAGLGDTDHALEWLEKSVARHERTVVSLRVSPVFDSLRTDPRFQGLLRRIGLWG